jgi:hypothetical protein
MEVPRPCYRARDNSFSPTPPFVPQTLFLQANIYVTISITKNSSYKCTSKSDNCLYNHSIQVETVFQPLTSNSFNKALLMHDKSTAVSCIVFQKSSCKSKMLTEINQLFSWSFVQPARRKTCEKNHAY